MIYLIDLKVETKIIDKKNLRDRCLKKKIKEIKNKICYIYTYQKLI